MKAVVRQAYGDTPSLQDVPDPVIGPEQVLLRVQAAGVDQGQWHLSAGLPYPVRLVSGPRRPKQPVLGLDVSGEVVAVGRDVTRFRVGDAVLGIGDGTWAELAAAPAGKLVPRPAGLPPEEAAALPVSGLTALQAVRDQARVRKGQSVLVVGASGGVGTFAVQVAKAYGAEVTGVCGPSKVDLVRDLGADRVLDHTKDPLDGRWDAVLDIGGMTPVRTLRRALTPTGTLVLVGGENGGRWLGGLQRQLGAVATNPFTRQRLRMFLSRETAADLEVLTGMVTAGTVRAAVDRTYPLADAADAIRHLREGRARGKLVLTA